jgi:hypothetical protein
LLIGTAVQQYVFSVLLTLECWIQSLRTTAAYRNFNGDFNIMLTL